MAETPPLRTTGPNGALVRFEASVADRDRAKWIHLASILAPLTAPLVGFIAGTKAPFIKAHALECAFDLLKWKILLFAVRIYMLFSAVLKIAQMLTQEVEFDWKSMIIRGIAGFVMLACFEIWNIIQAIAASKRAWKGQWPKKNFLHRTFRVQFPE